MARPERKALLERLPRVERLGTQQFSRIATVRSSDIAGMVQPALRVSVDQSTTDRQDGALAYAVRIFVATNAASSWKKVAGATFVGSDQVDEETGEPVIRDLTVDASLVLNKLVRVETDCPKWMSIGLDIEIVDLSEAAVRKAR